MKIKCPHCGKEYNPTLYPHGTEINCSACDNSFIVTDSTSTENTESSVGCFPCIVATLIFILVIPLSVRIAAEITMSFKSVDCTPSEFIFFLRDCGMRPDNPLLDYANFERWNAHQMIFFFLSQAAVLLLLIFIVQNLSKKRNN